MTSDGIVVVGSGSVDVAPDVVVADLGVDVRAADVSTGLAEAERGIERMRDGLLAAGVARTDLRTAQTSVWHEEHGDPDGGRVRTSVRVRLGLRAVLRDVGQAGELTHRAVADAGDAARIDGLAFGVEDQGEAEAAAREAAFADARSKAEQYATLAGRALGEVREVVEVTPDPVAPRARAMSMAAGAVPVEGGQQAVSAAVRVRWSWA